MGGMNADELRCELARLQAAIRKHRDMPEDDRCFEDDNELYAVLPEGFIAPQAQAPPEVQLESCKRYIANRQCPGQPWVTVTERINIAVEAEREVNIKIAESYDDDLGQSQSSYPGHMIAGLIRTRSERSGG